MGTDSGSDAVAVGSRWDPENRILWTELTGAVTVADVEAWRNELERAVGAIPDGSAFGLLLNLHGFHPVNLDAHKAMRTVVPLLLARHGMRPAFLDLFEGAEIPISTERGVRCVAFANVHHDPDKMSSYERRIAKPDQRFFTDASEAYDWLKDALQPGSEPRTA